MRSFIQQEIVKTRSTLEKILLDSALLNRIELATQECINALRQGNKILFAGNGGSAADSQHLAAELVSRLRYNRPGLAAIALTTDTSALTAIGNDYSFEYLFVRQLESLGRKGDVFIGISTSGKSRNILAALQTANNLDLQTIGFTGQSAPAMAELCKHLITVPNTETGKIQECHIMFGHIICGLIEEEIYGAQYNPQRQRVAA